MANIYIRDLGYYGNSTSTEHRKLLKVHVPMIGTVIDVYRDFNGSLTYGKVTCIKGHIGDGACGISYTLSGGIDYGVGEIALETKVLSRSDLAEIGVYLWHDYSSWRKRTVGKQLSEALSRENKYGLKTKQQILDLLNLPKGILDRPLHQLSHKRWPATIAIGVAQSKQLFAFPWLNPNYILSYRGAWLEHSLDVLKQLNAWTVISTSDPTSLAEIVDDVLVAKGLFHCYQ